MDRPTDDNNSGDTGQVIASAAETYEEFFVPALFGQWPDRLLDGVDLAPGDDVLDVGCGTGVLARAAARRLDGRGSVVGVDINPGMLDVAGRAPETVSWRNAPAESLPFDDDNFDRVLSQFALMFFADQRGAISEMARVARPGGSVSIATWAEIDTSPGYAAMVQLLDRLFGADAADALRAPFTVGTEQQLLALAAEALPNASVRTLDGTATFDSIDAWVHTDVRGWTLADMIDDEQYDELLEAARVDLAPYVGSDGGVAFAAPALVLHAPV